jgi:hypothetical protein
MKPDDLLAGSIYVWELSEALPQASYVLAAAHGVDRKSREHRDEAKRQKQTVEEIHRLEFKP